MITGLDTKKNADLSTLMPLIGRLTCYVRHHMSNVFKQLGYDLTPEAADALMIIHHFDGLPQKRLAQILGKDKAAITRLLNHLVKSKLVEREQDQQDRRIIRAHITTEGQRAFVQIYPELTALNGIVLASTDEQDFNAMVKTLAHIIDGLACSSSAQPSTKQPDVSSAQPPVSD